MYDIRQIGIVFDAMAGKVKQELDEQFDKKRIKETEYADVFNKLMDRALVLAYDAPLKNQQLLDSEKKNQLLDAQIRDQVYVTQAIRPKEAGKLQCDIELCMSQGDLVDAQKEDQVFVTRHIRPVEKDIAARNLAIKSEELEIKKKELLIKTQELEIAREKVTLAEKDWKYKEAQICLTNRQTSGFNDNKMQKLFDAQMNAWGLMYSSGMLDQVPSIITGDEVSALYHSIKHPTAFCQAPTRGTETKDENTSS